MEKPVEPHLKIKKKNAEKFIKFIKKYYRGSSILTNKFKVIQKDKHVFFPLNKDLPQYQDIKNQLKAEFDCEIVQIESNENRNYKPPSLESALTTRIPVYLMDALPKSYDIIGTIAIVELDQFNPLQKAKELKKIIAKAIIAVNHNIKTVFEKVSDIEGRFRLRKLEFLAGEENFTTIHKENSCNFKVDIRETFFSPRLNYERQRISNADIKGGELIVDLFSGVGPFSIQIAKSNNVKIFAFDVNPNAIKYLRENISLNTIKGTIKPYNKNVKELVNPQDSVGNLLKHRVDRIIMNLPKSSLDFIDVVSHLAKKSGCFVHNYQFCSKPHSLQRAINNLSQRLTKFDMKFEKVKHTRNVKSYSPKEEMIVVDALIKSTNFD